MAVKEKLVAMSTELRRFGGDEEGRVKPEHLFLGGGTLLAYLGARNTEITVGTAEIFTGAVLFSIGILLKKKKKS